MIEIKNVTKRFGEKVAVDNANLIIPEGHVVGFIGENGAGKSTLIKMMTGILKPTEGDILLNGYSITKAAYKAKEQFGYVSDSPESFLRMKAIDYINFMLDLYEVEEKGRKEKIEELAEEFGIRDSLHNRIIDFSHGMRQKLHIITVLLHNPKIWILDEPLVGLDPRTAFLLKQKIRKHAEEGNTVFFSTHVLSIAENLCDEIVIIKKGKIEFSGKLEDFKNDKEASLEEVFLSQAGD